MKRDASLKRRLRRMSNLALKALKEVVAELVRERARTGDSLVIWRDGKVVHMPAIAALPKNARERQSRRMQIRPVPRGPSESIVQVVRVSSRGVRLRVGEKEYALSYKEFPCFRGASLAKLQNVHLNHGYFLRWEALDVDLTLDALERPERYPLKSKVQRRSAIVRSSAGA